MKVFSEKRQALENGSGGGGGISNFYPFTHM